MTRIANDGLSARRRWSGLALTLGIGLSMLVGSAGNALAHAEHGHPARIHEGTCEDLGRVAFRLNGVGASVDLDNAPLPETAEVNPDKAYQVMVSETTIAGTLDDLLASDHAVMVYKSDEEMDSISCGNLGGAMVGDTLITGLAEAGIPGHLGFATFTSDGGQTVVEIMLGHAMAPVSASGGAGDTHVEGEAANDHQDGAVDDHAEEDDHGATTTSSS
jgi:hypothetical protein